jgi:hypothetical protein
VECGAIRCDDLDEVGLGEGQVFPTTQRSDGDNLAFPRGLVVHHHLRRSAGSRPQGRKPAAVPRELTVHTAGNFTNAATADVDDTQPAEPALVAGEGDLLSVGR